MTSIHMRTASAAGVTTRVFPLDDITIRAAGSGGDGRTVDAYAAVFDTPVEIHDHDGHYSEQIHRTAFNRSIEHRGTKFGVFYNHGMTLHGTASERGSMPLGVPLEVRADGRGVFTSTRYHKTELADETLEAIGSGAITGQSFTGRMLRSDPSRGPHRRSRGGDLVTVTRHEVGLIEYGPTPFPAYETAEITGVRTVAMLADDATLLRSILDAGDSALDEIVGALCDSDDERAAYLSRLDALATRLRAVPDERPGTADQAPAVPRLSRAIVRARLHRMGVL